MRAIGLTLLGLFFRIVYAGYCTQSYSCSKTCTKSEKYYKTCGVFGWGRCTRHKDVSYICPGTCYKRVCCSGYEGSSCNMPVCFGSVYCINGGTCTAPDSCSCQRGYSSPRCDDINECESSSHGCKHTCVNTPGSYKCTCQAGYTLATDLKSCLDVNECHTKNGGCDQICINMVGSYSCGCRNGYAKHGRTCSDLDECSLGTSDCAHRCMNTEGSFICSCNSGYALAIDGVNCEDKDECSDGTSNCKNICNNTPGSYTCYCGSGYVIADDGFSCEDVDECSYKNGDCDQICVNRPGFHRCECYSGFRMLGDSSSNTACIDIDECFESSAKCSQICSNTDGSYECSCNTGYLLDTDGFTCLDKNDCESIVCQNGGSCVDGLDFYTCVCKPGFHGQQCETDINECDLANAGCQDICTNSAGSFKCSCSDGSDALKDGFSCKGNENDTTVFERFKINRQLLPKPCFTVMLLQCTDGNDVDIFLSSTSEWFRLVKNPHVIYTLGIVFVKVNDYSIPLSLKGIEVTLKDKSFVFNYGVQYGPEQGHFIANDSTEDKCLPFDFVEADFFDFISKDSFMKSFLLSLIPGLPEWLRFEKSVTQILSVQDVKSELIYGKHLGGVPWCSGAPVIPEHLYSVFRFDSGFTLSVMESEVTLPKLLSSRKFCFIVDLCQSYGGTVFLMIPEESRNLLLELSIFKTLKEEQNIQILPRGIGISLANGINAESHALSDKLWNGDQMFTPLLPGVDLWIGGSMVKKEDIFIVKGNADIFLGVPSVQTMFTSLYREEWTGLIDIQLSIMPVLKFKLFEKEYSVPMQLITSTVNAYVSIGGSNRQWCGDVSNPQGFFLSTMIEINPFKGVPILEDFLISLSVRSHMFVISDPQDDSTTKINLGNAANDILKLEELLDNTVSILIITIANIEQSLTNRLRVIVTEVKEAAILIRNTIKANLLFFLSGNIEVMISEIETLRQSVFQMRSAVNNFFEETEFIVNEAIYNLNDLFESKIDIIENHINSLSSEITKAIITSVGQYTGFGLKFKTDFTIFGLSFVDIDIEIVYSEGNLFRCSRFEEVKKLLDGESSLRFLGRISRDRRLGRFLKLKRGVGLGGAFAINSQNVIINVQAFVSMLGGQATGDLFISKNGIFFYLEVNIWNIFLAQIEVIAEVGQEWHQLTFNLRGRFVANAMKKRQVKTNIPSMEHYNISRYALRELRRKRQIQTVSTSFQDGYLDSLKRAIRHVSDEAQKRLTQVRATLTFAQNGLIKAQNWFEEMQVSLKKANAVFDTAVNKLDRTKEVLEEAKGPMRKAIKSLEDAQINIDNLCKIRTCSGICIPGIKCGNCYKKTWLGRIQFPCCKYTSCMIRLPNIPCIIANIACKIIRAAAYVILELAKFVVRGAMLAFDIAKAAVTVAQFAVDKSRVVLTVAEGILELAQIGLQVAKMVLDAAKIALEAVKQIIGAAVKVLEFVIEYGLKSIIDVRNCGFDIELSTKDLPVFEVSCEVNAFRLGWTTIGLKINFKNILQSLWQAATATIKAIVNVFGGIFSGRKRRDIEFDLTSRMHVFLRKIRESDTTNYLNESIDISKNITGFRDTDDDDSNNRIELFREKCFTITVIQEFMHDAFSSLQGIVNESKLYMDEVDGVKRQLEEYNSIDLSTENVTVENVGISSEYAGKDYNMTKDHLDKAINDTKAAAAEDPLLAELKSAANIAVESVDLEKKSVESIDYQSAWFAAMKNMTRNYFNETECEDFQDCIFYSISSLYALYESESLPNVSLIQESILDLEGVLIETFQNESSSIMDTSLAMENILNHVNYLVSVNLFCSKPPQFLTDLQNQTAVYGSSVKMHCNVSGDPEPHYTWLKNDTILLDETLSILTIPNVSSKDSFDKYTCVAGNVVTNITSNEAYIIVIHIDEDECKTNSSICQQICTETLGSIVCSCYDGFMLEENRETCSDMNECAINNGHCNGSCFNFIGNYKCACPPKYMLMQDGISCADARTTSLFSTIRLHINDDSAMRNYTVYTEIIKMLERYLSLAAETEITVFINGLREGSIIAEFTVVFEDNGLADFTSDKIVLALISLKDGGTLMFGEKQITVETLFSADTTDLCRLREEVVGLCEKGSFCEVVNNTPTCRNVLDDKNKANYMTYSVLTVTAVSLTIIVSNACCLW